MLERARLERASIMKEGKLILLIPVVIEHAPDCPHAEKSEKKGASTGVSTDAYRKGWDTIFGKQEVGQA